MGHSHRQLILYGLCSIISLFAKTKNPHETTQVGSGDIVE
ncbi:hypothetical protein Mal35_24540 [Gimesia maris]|nr:hypothetical protein Mal35_24540 [Gimesia maris]